MPGKATTWQDYLIGLDISSFGQLTLALLFSILAWNGIRNTLWRRFRDGAHYFDQAYNVALFHKGFASLCVQFGLLGTLLSFLLAAVAQMADTVSKAPQGTTVLEKRVAEVAHEGVSASEKSSPIVASGDSSAKSESGATRELSSQVFLLLCASLVSTFVGTFVAYIIIPPLNQLNFWAMGQHQLGVTDDQNTAEEFLRQLDRTTQRLGDFERATEVLVSAADGVERFHSASRDATMNFNRMMKLLEQAAEMLISANQRMDRLSRRIGGYEEHSERVFAQIRHFADELQKPLQRMNEAASRIQLSALAGDKAFVELQKVAHSMRQPLEKVTEISNVNWTMLSEMRKSLQALASGEENQSAAIGQAVASLAEIHGTLQKMLVKASSVERELIDLTQLEIVPGSQHELMPDDMVQTDKLSENRSLWRRTLGWLLKDGNASGSSQARRTENQEDSKKKDIIS
jgi:hypothetical protein